MRFFRLGWAVKAARAAPRKACGPGKLAFRALAHYLDTKRTTNASKKTCSAKRPNSHEGHQSQRMMTFVPNTMAYFSCETLISARTISQSSILNDGKGAEILTLGLDEAPDGHENVRIPSHVES